MMKLMGASYAAMSGWQNIHLDQSYGANAQHSIWAERVNWSQWRLFKPFSSMGAEGHLSSKPTLQRPTGRV